MHVILPPPPPDSALAPTVETVAQLRSVKRMCLFKRGLSSFRQTDSVNHLLLGDRCETEEGKNNVYVLF